MVNTYHLVNPYIQGNFDTKIKAKNSNEAANIFYTGLSEHFNNSVNKFYFSIQKGSSGDGKLYHYEVKEERNNNEVDISIKKFEGKTNNDKFKNKLGEIKSKLDGGSKKHRKHKKHSDDSSSDSDSSSDIYITKSVSLSQPITYWWYDPYLYNLKSVYVPTFYSYITPYILYSLY